MKERIFKVAAAVMALSISVSSACFAADNDKLTEITYNYDGHDYTRYMEKLSRGLVAVKIETGVYLSWRMMGDECSIGNITNAPNFTVYKNGVKLADVTDSTNYVDESGTLSDKYSVAIEGGSPCEEVSVWENDYIEITLEAPEDEVITYPDGRQREPMAFKVSEGSCGDLDGDGEYEIIIRWLTDENDVGAPLQSGETADAKYSGTYRFAAYKLDGTKMWDKEINLGKNVYASAHTTQFLVYDFNGDGKSEMICQTSLGSMDAKGNYVSKAGSEEYIKNYTDEDNANADFRGDGIVKEGDEFLTVFSGETGEAIDTITLPTKRVEQYGAEFGDTKGNRSNRFLGEVAYLDGEKPYAIYWRGYYYGENDTQRTSICGVSFDGQKLSCDYNFDTYPGQPGYSSGNEKYTGQGNHNLTVADVDDDGKDEFISGAMCMEVDENNKLNPKWCTFKGHGDALHIGNYDPTHKGFEVFTVHEEGNEYNINGELLNYGMSVLDGETGDVIFHVPALSDTGRGLMANTGMGGYYQISANKNYIAYGVLQSGDFAGEHLFRKAPEAIGNNYRIFWDGDLYDETFNRDKATSWVPRVWDWDGTKMAKLRDFESTTTVCGTKAVPVVQADLFGDWREELVLPTNDGTKLRIYTTTIPTEYKLPTLMHDPVYRIGVAAEQTTYNQPPHIGFYLAEEIFKK